MTTIPTRPELLLAQTGWLRALARQLVSDEHGAEDLTQETLLAALRAERPKRAPVRAWLAGIARNLSANARRRDARRRVHESSSAAVAGERAAPSAAETAEQFAVHRAVVEAVAALEEPYRQTVLLRFWEGLPPREIAHRRGVPVETVRTHLKRGLARLRARLDESRGGRAAWALPLIGWSRAPVARATVPAVAAALVSWALPLAAVAVLVGVVAVTLRGSDDVSPAAPASVVRAGRADVDATADGRVTEGAPERRAVTLPAPPAAARQDPQDPQPVPDAVTAEWLFWAPGDEPHGGAGGKFGGRGGGRSRLGERGGSKYADGIAAGLAWLARHQAEDGSFAAELFWKRDADGAPGDGAGERGRDVGATAVALLAFLGDGQTCWSGEHEEVLRGGVLWLCRHQDPESGAFVDPRIAPRHAFDHALATWALAEAYGLSELLRLRPFVDRALTHLDELRVEQGGWSAPMADTTIDVAVVTAFAQMARVVARDFRLRERSEAADALAAAWAAGRLATPAGVPVAPHPWNTSAVAVAESELVLARFLSPNEPTADQVVARVVRGMSVEGVVPGRMATHLAALGAYQVGGRTWKTAMRSVDRLLDEQREDGRFAGSWDPAGPWTDRTGGRVLATALATMTLQTFYRFTRLVR